MRKFISNDKRFEVQLPSKIITKIIGLIAAAGKKETGGIIIGSYSLDRSCAIVSYVSGPPKDSKSGFNWFQRGKLGLQTLLNRQWEKEEQTYYLGEWHFHPFSSPDPSFQDKLAMSKISEAAEYNCPEPILLIIGGHKNDYKLQLFVISRSEGFIPLKNDF
ncbi:Mov34/MPN/PAD-1 family protein [Chitinophaga sp. OAE865]|uniref:Mov34/MPN/PAD-1 family protein n=1 Tax=Chitinophaga sp. OAE865 TaxID=2817898 RepID=UPI001AE4D410